MSPVVVLVFFSSTLISATLGQLGLSTQQAQAVVDAHNAKRVLPWRDGTTYGGNTRKLNWDAAIAALAQTWAVQMCLRRTMEHDKNDCIIVGGERICGFGQNLAMGYQTEVDITAALKESVDMWYKEIDESVLTDLDPFVFNDDTGYYTQVVWANTSRIGCGTCNYDEDGYSAWKVACYYYPA